ncbi:MAG: thiamine pyrophosphate-dependent dehydrogenase E1 component subunit alpha [bacterium]
MSDVLKDMPLSLLEAMYTTMLRIRRFEERTGELIEAGEIHTPCHLYIGQEAVATGVCAALAQEDTIWGGHRSHGHYLAKGGDMDAMMAEIYGKVTGCSKGRGGSMHLVAPNQGIYGTVPIVAATISLAVGAGMASKLRRDGGVSVSFFGDGSVEEGQFHESLNLAALYRLPVVFVCENNLYSSHMHILERRLKDNIYQSGIVHGIPAHRIDGNDVIGVYRSAKDAVEQARSGQGPTLLECRTFRWRGHVGPSSDMDVGIKRKDELNTWLERDPITRARAQLVDAGIPPGKITKIHKETDDAVEQAILFARKSPYAEPGTLSDHLYCSEERC